MMKTTIYLTGDGIISKNTLLRNIPVQKNQVRQLPFNNYALDFRTKKEAINALSKAYQSIRSDFDKKDISYERGLYLRYDAGKAEINRL